MCTLSFIPKPGGYLIGMNRDERFSREHALPPQIKVVETLECVFPREAAGGTWIAANSRGVSFALLNCNTGLGDRAKLKSRGEVVPALIESARAVDAMRRLQELDLRGVLPFRLIGFFPAEEIIAQWHWDTRSLGAMKLVWHPRHWFSSGVSDELARKTRELTCLDAWRRRDAGSAEWLRHLHASHAPVRGSFSVCVHRPDAASLSYTEISCGPRQLTMRYHAGHPCERPGHVDSEITLPAPGRHPLAAAS